jgi:outer membrane protein
MISASPRRRPSLHRRALSSLFLLGLTAAALAPAADAQATGAAGAPRQLSLQEALRMAEQQSEAVAIARAGVSRATGQRLQAASQRLPQLYASGGYSKTLASQFEGLSFGPPARDPSAPEPPQSVCTPRIPAGATAEERAAALAQATTCSGGDAGGIDFGSVGFGARNQWSVGLSVSQNLFTGGRVAGQVAASEAQERTASIELAVQRAQTQLDVAAAYFDAALADRLVAIAEASLVQAEDILRQARVGREVGNLSEFDLLRAQVTRDNLMPVQIQARTARQVSYLRLRQLLELPLDQPLELSTPLESAEGAVAPTVAGGAADTSVSLRAPVRQLEEAVRAQEGLQRVARSERLPSLSLVSGYQRLYFPSNFLPDLGAARQNWTVGVNASMALFTGGRVRGSQMVAAANLEETRQRLQQVRELAALDARIAASQLEQAEASWRATQGTSAQAQRAYEIDQVRFREGISSQTDLAQSRLLLQQATANRAQAARDLAIARLRLSLLRDLPLQLGGGAGAAPLSSQQNQSTQAAAPPSAGGSGGPTGSNFR